VIDAGATVMISWTGGTANSLISIDCLLPAPNLLPDAQVYTTINLGVAYNAPPYNYNATIASTFPSGDYILTLSVLTQNFESTDVSDQIPVHISGQGTWVFDIVTTGVPSPFSVTLYGNTNQITVTLSPTQPSQTISMQVKNIGYVYQASSTSSSLVAMIVHTDQSTKSAFGMVTGANSSDCSLAESCDTCNLISTCGWCDSSQLCLPTTENVPNSPSIGVCSKNWLSNKAACHSFSSSSSIANFCCPTLLTVLGMLLFLFSMAIVELV